MRMHQRNHKYFVPKSYENIFIISSKDMNSSFNKFVNAYYKLKTFSQYSYMVKNIYSPPYLFFRILEYIF